MNSKLICLEFNWLKETLTTRRVTEDQFLQVGIQYAESTNPTYEIDDDAEHLHNDDKSQKRVPFKSRFPRFPILCELWTNDIVFQYKICAFNALMTNLEYENFVEFCRENNIDIEHDWV